MPGEGLELSQTKAGVTVSLEGIVDDGIQAYIPAQITFDEGQYDRILTYMSGPVCSRRNRTPARPQRRQPDAGGPQPRRCHRTGDADRQLRGLRAGDAVELTVYYIFGNRTDASGGTETAWTWEKR